MSEKGPLRALFIKIRDYFRFKSYLLKILKETNKLYESQKKVLTRRIEELEQDRLYLLYLADATSEELINARQALSNAMSNMQWTCPPILVTNRPMASYSKENLKEMIREVERRERNKRIHREEKSTAKPRT